ncbi:MAG: DUF1801 domain-containing protein [Gemmatimonadaceae bacterium]
MAEPKTKRTGESVDEFIAGVAPERQADCRALVRMMTAATGAPPEMWGASIVGFGSYRYKYVSGREADWPLAGFSPRKSDLTVYLAPGFEERHDLMTNLGKHKSSKACLYVKRLSDVDVAVLRELIDISVAETRKRHA